MRTHWWVVRLLPVMFRYGQEDIEKMLLEMGAVETVEVPKKVSIVDVDPPWVRRVSRREPAA